MKHLKKIAIGIAVFIALFLVIGFLLPGSYQVERSLTISAKPEKIYPYISATKRWPEWSAWNQTRFPDMTYNYSGPESGVGSESNWNGKSSGKGRMKLTKADPAKGITYDLDFDDGTYLSVGTISFEPAGDATKVIWVTSGNLNGPIQRWMGLLMDKFMGPDFETGLKNLKDKSEAK